MQHEASGGVAAADVRTNIRSTGLVTETTADELRRVLAAAARAAAPVARSAPSARAAWLDTIAAALEGDSDVLSAMADEETGLGAERLRGEIARAADQLRFYGSVATEGSYLGVAIDDPGTAPALLRVNLALGPVAVFGASNFPFAFGLLGHDTGSALAAGCPVIVKGHPAHPRTSARLGEIASEALRAAGAPEGTFEVVYGFDTGSALVRAPEVRAVAFTGSQRGGMALWRMANEREHVIACYAEMGTVNPVVLTPGAMARMGAIADGFVASFTLGHGQFCTKPGLLLAPAGHGFPETVGAALRGAAPSPRMLTEAIAADVVRGVDELVAAGARIVARVPGADSARSAPAVVLTAPAATVRKGSRLLEECFGAVALVVEYGSAQELDDCLSRLQGSLAGSVFGGGPSDAAMADAVTRLTRQVGRVTVDEWPTGVTTSWAQQHGGPWPATSNPAATSVGAAALARFVRPVAFQSVPLSCLPPHIAEMADPTNPLGLPRRVSVRSRSR